MLKQLMTIALVITSTILSTEAKACGDYCGYSALDYTGGSNLLNFGVNVYIGLDAASSSYGYDTTSYGGGCGSFLSSCNSPYESVGLYGNNWGMYTPSTDFSLNLDLSFLSSMSFLGNGMMGTDVGCCLGYCSDSGMSSWLPFMMGIDSSLIPPTTMPMPILIPGMANPYLPVTYPYPQIPGTGINIPGVLPDPLFPTIPPIFTPTIPQPPTVVPPYGVCDNIVVMCPGVQPPVTQPPVTQPPVVIPPTTNPPVIIPPTHQPPTTQPPTTHPPVIIPPVTQPPTTQPPVVIPPQTQPPTTQPPVVIPPVIIPPVTQPPVTQPPVTQPPVTQPPVFTPSPFQPVPVDPNRGNLPRGARAR